MAMAMDSVGMNRWGNGESEWARGVTWCREAWEEGFVGMSVLGDIGMRAPSVRAD